MSTVAILNELNQLFGAGKCRHRLATVGGNKFWFKVEATRTNRFERTKKQGRLNSSEIFLPTLLIRINTEKHWWALVSWLRPGKILFSRWYLKGSGPERDFPRKNSKPALKSKDSEKTTCKCWTDGIRVYHAKVLRNTSREQSVARQATDQQEKTGNGTIKLWWFQVNRFINSNLALCVNYGCNKVSGN